MRSRLVQNWTALIPPRGSSHGPPIAFGRRISLEYLGDSNIGVRSYCGFGLMVYLNPRLFVRILSRPGVTRSQTRNRPCNSRVLYVYVNDICAVADFLSHFPHSARPIAINRSPPFANQRSAASAAEGRTVVYAIATGTRAPRAGFSLAGEAHRPE
jgi:hypothetical protein